MVGVIFDIFDSPLSQKQFFEVYFPDTSTLQTYSREQLSLAKEWFMGHGSNQCGILDFGVTFGFDM